MPRRSNLFQEVVAIIHRHMAGDATVEESAMLPSPVTGHEREVDVLIRTRVAGHDVTVAVEATARGRRADTPWVEAMLGKHNNLPTDKLVLVAEGGFSKPAREVAEKAGVVALAPHDFVDEDPCYTIVNRLKSIWPKYVSFTPQRARVWVQRPDGQTVWFKAPADLWVFLDGGTELGTLHDYVQAEIQKAWPKIVEDIELSNITDNQDEAFTLALQPSRVQVDGQSIALYVRYEEAEARPELHLLKLVEVTGRAVIKVHEVTLTHGRLGDVSFAYGQSTPSPNPALLVVTEDESGGALTIRFRDGK